MRILVVLSKSFFFSKQEYSEWSEKARPIWHFIIAGKFIFGRLDASRLCEYKSKIVQIGGIYCPQKCCVQGNSHRGTLLSNNTNAMIYDKRTGRWCLQFYQNINIVSNIIIIWNIRIEVHLVDEKHRCLHISIGRKFEWYWRCNQLRESIMTYVTIQLWVRFEGIQKCSLYSLRNFNPSST